MSGRETERALADCLQLIESGEATTEDALGRYPALRQELESLVALALELRAMPAVTAPESLRGWKRPVFRSAPVENPVSWWRRLRLSPLPSFTYDWATPALRVAAALAVAMLVGSGTLVASAGSLPEEPLYPVKLAVENARLALAANHEERTQLEMEFASRRLGEIEAITHQEGTKARAVEHSAALYEESISRAVNVAAVESRAQGGQQEEIQAEEDTARVETRREEVAPQIQEALKHNYEVLERVRDRFNEKQSLETPGSTEQERVVAAAEHERAVAAIEAAMERTQARYEKRAESGKSADSKGAEKESNRPEPTGSSSSNSAPQGGQEGAGTAPAGGSGEQDDKQRPAPAAPAPEEKGGKSEAVKPR